MKRVCFFLLVLLVRSFPVSAEIVTLCKAFKILTESSEKKFKDIQLNENENLPIYKTSMLIENAQECYIIDNVVSKKTYFAIFGKYPTENAAIAEVELLKKEISKCYPSISFNDYYYNNLQNKCCNFINKVEKGYRFYKAYFCIKKEESKFTVYLEFEGISRGGGLTPKYTHAYNDYYYYNEKKSSDQFTRDIERLISESKFGLKKYLGEEVDSDSYFWRSYKALFQIYGFNNCTIEDRSSVYFYSIPYKTNISKTAALDAKKEAFFKIKSALGNDYAYSEIDGGLTMCFVNKNKPEKIVLTINIEPKKESKYDISISIKSELEN